MAKQVTQERRSVSRAKRVLSIQYRIFESKENKIEDSWHLSATQDMSIEGLSFLSDYEYRPGTVLELHVVMSGVLDIYNGFGEVLRADRNSASGYFKIAVKFIEKPVKKRNAKTYKKSKSKSKKLV